MEKIMVAIDSQKMNHKTIGFACFLTRLTQSKLTGIFVEQPVMEEEIIYKQSARGTEVESIGIISSRNDEINELIRDEYINLFRELTQEEKVEANIHLDQGLPVEEVIAESRFADVLIVDPATSFSDIRENPLSGFVKNILHDAECPVIISPENFEGIDNIIFCYDGSKSSVFAIKQFSHLFPQLKSRIVKILCLKNEEELGRDELRRLTEWLKYHYNNNVEWIIPQPATKASLFDYIIDKQDDFIVMGHYGKGMLVSFFKKESEKTAALPIFVSHV